MPCYIIQIKGPSQSEYEKWKKIGYLGTWEDYSCAKRSENGSTMFICGDFGAHCACCAGVGDFLCDFPVGNEQTCDRPMCIDHAHEIGHELHYCETHYKMWQDFKASGGVDAALRNVIAFKSEK